MASSLQLLRELFNLPLDENIFDDFGCALNNNILVQGRMYLTEKRICFASDILGMSKHQAMIAYEEISMIEKSVTYGLFDSGIDIVAVDNSKNLNFCSFQNRDFSFQRMRTLWKNCLRKTMKHVSDTEGDEEEDYEEIVRNHNKVADQERIKRENSQKRQNSILEPPHAHKDLEFKRSLSQFIPKDFNEEQKGNKFDIPKLNLDANYNKQRTLSKNTEKALSERPKSLDIGEVDNAQLFNESSIMNEEALIEDIDQSVEEIEVSDEALKQLAKDQIPKLFADTYKEQLQVIIPMSLKEFFATFFANDAKYGPEAECKKLQRKDTKIDEWKEENGVTHRWLYQIVPVKGVPIFTGSETRHWKEIKLIKNEATELIIDMENKSLDIPYAESFLVEEKWVALTTSEKQYKCILVIGGYVNFLKSPFVKGMIQSRAMEELHKSYQIWLQHITELGYLEKKERPKKEKPKLPKRKIRAKDSDQNMMENLMTNSENAAQNLDLMLSPPGPLPQKAKIKEINNSDIERHLKTQIDFEDKRRQDLESIQSFQDRLFSQNKRLFLGFGIFLVLMMIMLLLEIRRLNNRLKGLEETMIEIFSKEDLHRQ